MRYATAEMASAEGKPVSVPVRLASHFGFALMTALLASVAQPVTAEADRQESADDVTTLTVQGSRAIASGYEARGTLIQQVDVDEQADLPATMVELLTQLPGVVESGQGGWVQTLSVRGVSRQRVLTFVGGIPVLTDRRAGSSGHFVDPALLGDASVMAGPASSIYGLGALGGIVQFFPRRLEGPVAALQFDNNNDGRSAYVGWGDDTRTVMLAGSKQDNSEAADGSIINDHGERWSALLQQRWQLPSGELDLLAVPARIRDMGRANANFYLGRVVTTPYEDHLPVRLSYRANSGWEAAWFGHDNSVRNVTDRIDVSLTTVDNDATNTGLSWQLPWQQGEWQARIGLDWLARLAVEADERSYLRATETTVFRDALRDGEEQQFSVFGEMETGWLGGELQWGLRLTAQQQSARGESSVHDDAYAAHLGWERLFADRWFVFGSLGSAVRFPALTERFYNGATGRGTLVGNAELSPETALSFDLGVRTRMAGAVLSAQWYRQQVDDYIEQVVLQNDPQINSYINLTEGTIEGLQFDSRWPLTDQLTATLSAHRIRGEDSAGNPLADIPADRWQLAIEQQWQQCGLTLGWTWRREKRDAGPDEIELASADYGNASLRCAVAERWQVALVLSNANDELYWANADSQAALMPGRRISLRIGWQ